MLSMLRGLLFRFLCFVSYHVCGVMPNAKTHRQPVNRA
jgi:hypothetical protein